MLQRLKVLYHATWIALIINFTHLSSLLYSLSKLYASNGTRDRRSEKKRRAKKDIRKIPNLHKPVMFFFRILMIRHSTHIPLDSL